MVDTASVRTSSRGRLAAAVTVMQLLLVAWRAPGSLVRMVLAAGLLWLHPAATRCDEDWEYIVRPGDTLWDLTEQYLSDLSFVPQLQSLNQVADPYRMLPGTRLRMPLAWMKSEPGAARFLSVHGDVLVEAVANSEPRKALAGATLQAGDIVRTQAEGHAAVAFFDGSVVSLHPESVLLLKVMRSYAAGLNTVRVELTPGRAETRVRPPRGHASRFEIQTPAGITSVRGTDLRVSVPADEKLARTEVLAGEVVVAGAGKDVVVAAGYGTVVRVGQPPAPPVALLPPPDLTALPQTLISLPAEIDFPAVSGAVAYRVQLARGSQFEQVVFETLSDAPRVRLPEFPNAHYVLRVRAVHVAGLEGQHAERPVELAVRPPAPSLIEPQDGAETSAAPLRFRWRSANPGLIYRFQLARGATFSEPIEDLAGVPNSEVIIERALPSGVYHWRVAATHPEQDEGPFSAARTFRRTPAAPTLERTGLTPAQIQLHWRGDRADRRYHVQLARDPEITQVVIDTYADRPALDLPRPPAGRYFLRIRAVEPDGYEGPYEPPTAIDVGNRPLAPRLASPEDGAVVSGEATQLRWYAQEGPARYRVQLATDTRFSMVVLDRQGLTSTSLSLGQALAPGAYFWRVAASTESDGEGAFSEARTLRVSPTAPELAAPEIVGDRLVFRWGARPFDRQYHLQLAKDEEFRNLIVDRRVGATELSVPRPAAGRYFARVSAEDANGVAGPFSAPRTVQISAGSSFWLLPLVPLFFLP